MSITENFLPFLKLSIKITLIEVPLFLFHYYPLSLNFVCIILFILQNHRKFTDARETIPQF